MSSYVLRRRTWYRCLLDCSSEMRLPDMVLAEQLLACASISHDHQLLIRTAPKGEVSFANVAEELVAQHGKVHEREKRASGKGGHHRRPGQQGKSWHGGRAWKPTGYYVDDISDGGQDFPDDDPDEGDGEAYFGEEEMDVFDEYTSATLWRTALVHLTVPRLLP